MEKVENVRVKVTEFRNPEGQALAIMYGLKVTEESKEELKDDLRFVEYDGDLYFADFIPITRTGLVDLLRCTYDAPVAIDHLLRVMDSEGVDRKCVKTDFVIYAVVLVSATEER